jgi:hypothetical protein
MCGTHVRTTKEQPGIGKQTETDTQGQARTPEASLLVVGDFNRHDLIISLGSSLYHHTQDLKLSIEPSNLGKYVVLHLFYDTQSAPQHTGA